MAGDAVWDGNAEQASVFRCDDAVRGVFKRDGLLGTDAKPTQSLYVEVRSRLGVINVLCTDDRIESVSQSEPCEMSLDPRSLGA